MQSSQCVAPYCCTRRIFWRLALPLLLSLCGTAQASLLGDLIAGRCPTYPVIVRARLNLTTALANSGNFGPCTAASAIPMAAHDPSNGLTAQDRHGHCLFAYSFIDSSYMPLISCEDGIGIRPVHVIMTDCGDNNGAFFDEDGPGGDLAAVHCLGGSMHIEGLWPYPQSHTGEVTGADTRGWILDFFTVLNTMIICGTFVVIGLGIQGKGPMASVKPGALLSSQRISPGDGAAGTTGDTL